MSKELFDFAAKLVHETEKAWLLDTGGPKKVWIPKSQGQDNGDGTFTVPIWLAKEKEII